MRICCGERDFFVVLDSDEMRIVSKRGGNTREAGSIGEHFTDKKGTQSCGKEDDHGRVGNAQYPSVLCVCDNELSCCEQGQHQVQSGGGIEGDGDDRGDGNEDAPYSLSLNNSQAQRSRAPAMFFEQEKAVPGKQ
ncbi:hypothetical protein ARMSODRAFT_1017040 [Armillaria solidipes]|uniref:Uncharacterized protein n=1 Tax=Armillaria solidipes TaxID=1076256 RepID=A0A2H3C2S5_9AGAR|nr:hypothetical protein ARMSODRAFT_1017040 [Armillaria solidipes]